MPLTLHVDGPRWRDHLTSVAEANPGIVPVAKGNGYGFGLASLARRADWLGVDTIAVGTYGEVAGVEQRFDGSILVLEPWRPFLDVSDSPRVIHTVGRDDDLAALGDRADSPRVVLEVMTSMRRHGFAPADVPKTARGVRVEGHAVHLPLGSGHVAEVEQIMQSAPHDTWYVSHLSAAEIAELSPRAQSVRPRIGTALWLGDREALAARATVLDAHSVKRGDRVGYRQRRITRDGTLLVVSGGTSHGIGLEAPAPASSAKQRATALARGGLNATGLALSPFKVAGKQRWFAEPPHMQVSMIVIPESVEPPAIGDELDVDVRFTATTFNHVAID